MVARSPGILRWSLVWSVLSASPGIVLSVLGTVLMMTAIMSTADIGVDDHSTYIARWSTPVAKIREVPEGGGAQPTAKVRENAIQRLNKAREELLDNQQ
jgi:hypothetical protein